MKPKIPRSPFTTRLSGSAKETELRLRNIFQWKKKRPPALLLLAAFLAAVGCGGLIGFTSGGSSAASAQTPDFTPQEETPGASPSQSVPGTAGSQTGTDLPLSLAEAFEQVLLNERPFFYTDQTRSSVYQDHLYLSDVTKDDSTSMSPAQFTAVDLDGDGAPEVVYQRSDYRGFVILRYKQGSVYGHAVNYRAMQDLKEDGSFLGSAGADSTTFGKMRFLGSYCDVEYQAIQWNENDYELHGEPIDRDTFGQLWSAHRKLSDAGWHEYTNDMVRQWLAHDLELLDAPLFPEPTATQDYLDSLAGLLYCNFYPGAEAADAELAASYQSYYDGWNCAMDAIYQLCLEKASGSDLDTLIAGQQQWLAACGRWEDSALPDKNLQLGSMAKERTYRLISFYFEDHFYD